MFQIWVYWLWVKDVENFQVFPYLLKMFKVNIVNVCRVQWRKLNEFQ